MHNRTKTLLLMQVVTKAQIFHTIRNLLMWGNLMLGIAFAKISTSGSSDDDGNSLYLLLSHNLMKEWYLTIMKPSMGPKRTTNIQWENGVEHLIWEVAFCGEFGKLKIFQWQNSSNENTIIAIIEVISHLLASESCICINGRMIIPMILLTDYVMS